MDRETYSRRLRAIVPTGLERDNANMARSIAGLCPHLNEGQIRSILQSLTPTNRMTTFTAPPLLVLGSYQLLSVMRSAQDESQLSLRWFGSGRTPASFAGGIMKGCGTNQRHLLSDVAIAYAEQQWKDTLIQDVWTSSVTVFLQDPTKPERDGSPTTTMVMTFVTRDNWLCINDKRSVPLSEVIDRGIMHITSCPLEASELVGGRPVFAMFNCAACGGGLELQQCSYCKRAFTDANARTEWSSPLPPKLSAFVSASGHSFTTDPTKAREEERKAWEG